MGRDFPSSHHVVGMALSVYLVILILLLIMREVETSRRPAGARRLGTLMRDAHNLCILPFNTQLD